MTKLTMVLARGPRLPEGDLNDRMTVDLSLTAQGLMDGEAFDTREHAWLAARERPGLDVKRSELVQVDDGWALQGIYGDDDPLWQFEGHVFRPGELVVLRRPDSEELIFRIVASETE